jgi:predicted nucleic acid-binding protein
MSTATQELEQGAEDLKEAAASEAEAVQDAAPEQELSLDHEALFANADTRRDLRRKADKVELRLAFRDLADGVRGLIRVAPFTAVLAGVALGLSLGKRSSSRRLQPRR